MSWLLLDVADELCDLRASYIEPALAEQKCEAEWELGAEYEYAYCSHCGHQQWADWDSRHEASENIGEFHKKYKFCPNCGNKIAKGCPNCGAELAPGAKFCPNCGNKI